MNKWFRITCQNTLNNALINQDPMQFLINKSLFIIQNVE